MERLYNKLAKKILALKDCLTYKDIILLYSLVELDKNCDEIILTFDVEQLLLDCNMSIATFVRGLNTLEKYGFLEYLGRKNNKGKVILH